MSPRRNLQPLFGLVSMNVSRDPESGVAKIMGSFPAWRTWEVFVSDWLRLFEG